jgi:DNA mismatch repair protein MutL
VNRRPVQNRRLARAVYEAYLGQLPSLRHPGWVLFLDVDPATVDVNVHPSKREVKLTHESELFGFLLSAVRASLSSGAPSAAPVDSEGGSASAPPHATGTFYTAGTGSQGATFGSPATGPRPAESVPLRTGTLFDAPAAFEHARPELADLRDPNLTVLGQIKKTYIIAHTSGGLVVADQHAAAEKVAYERLLSNMKSEAPQIQMLLVPFTWEVAMSLAPRIQDGLHLWRRMGFMIEPFGGDTFVVKGLPSHLGDRFEITVLLDAMCDAITDPEERRGTSLEHRLAAAAACKASVKAGDPLDNAGARQILKELAACENPFTCPHGRPTMIRWGFGDLETKFRRR